MKKVPLTLKDYRASVIAVPPAAWTADLALAEKENIAILRHIEAGGIRIVLYGGNANLYHFDRGRLGALLALAGAAAGAETAIVPSIGPDFGKMIDQAPVIRASGCQDVMVLPASFPVRRDGLERGLRLAADALGFGVVLYVKQDQYLEPARIERLVADGVVRFVKYAVERPDPAGDGYLSDIIGAIGRERVASGMGETPIHCHLLDYGLATFTSGGASIAPRATMDLLAAYRRGDRGEAERLRAPFLAFERLRAATDGFAVLHDGVALAGFETGPILPLLANLPLAARDKVRAAVAALVQVERACRGVMAEAG